MFSVSTKHLHEISAIPELLELVHNNAVENANIDTFLRLCVQHKCRKTFTALLPNTNFREAGLTLLASLNAVDMVSCIDVSTLNPEKWKRAARRAAKAGHVEFVAYILTQIDHPDIRKAAACGACMGDHPDILKKMVPTIDDQSFLHHIPVLAAQHNAVACVRQMLETMPARVWASTLSAALFNDGSLLPALMLESIPPDLDVTHEWAVKVAVRGLSGHNKDPQKLLCFVLQYITCEDILKMMPVLSPNGHQHIIAAHQYVLLSATAEGLYACASKRKM